jgi:glycerol-3-phosphate acyltransferase PlsY
MFTILLTLIIGYLLGSIPFGLLLTRLSGYGDIRNIGSGNIGATNVLRTGNKKLALATLLLDGMKGALAFALIRYFTGSFDMALLGGGAALIGHIYPVWLQFKGGKGVATTLGLLLAASPISGIIACATWLIVAKISRISSLSALVAVLTTPLTAYFVSGNLYLVALCLLCVALIYIRHADNIRRLLKGEEPKIGQKKKAENE